MLITSNLRGEKTANSESPVKTDWTWEEWLASRKARRQAADRISPLAVRRRESSSDRRLRAAFKGERGPDFGTRT